MMVVQTRTSKRPASKSSITRSSMPSAIWPWPMAILARGTRRRTRSAARLDGVHPVVDEEDLAAAVQLAVDGVPHQAVVVLRDAGLDRQPCLRRRLDDGQVADAHQAEVQGARNRRGRQGQHVDLLAERLDALLVRHAEALLLVDHQQSQVGEGDVLRQDPMRPDQHVDRAVGNARHDLLLLPLRHEAAEHGHLHRERAEPPLEGAKVLLRQDGGRAPARPPASRPARP